MKLRTTVLFTLFLLCLPGRAFGQKISLKTNLAYWVTATPNLTAEFALTPKMTLEVGLGYNPFITGEEKSFEHLMVQPELRWWFFRPLAGMFVGFHLHGGIYDAGGVGPIKTLKDSRYDGWLAGAGISVGYHWLLSARWGIECEAGVGYAYMKYDKTGADTAGQPVKFENSYFGPTRLNLSIVYYLK